MNNVYTMRNFLETEQAGRNSAIQEQQQNRAMKQQNALDQMDPMNLDPNQLWQAGQHEQAIKLVQDKINKSTENLDKIAAIMRDNVTDQDSYEKALTFIGQAFPESAKILERVPKQYDPYQVGMFVQASSKAVATRPELRVVRQPDGTVKVVDITRHVGQVIGEDRPLQSEQPRIMTDAQGRIVQVTPGQDGPTMSKPIGPARVGAGGISPTTQAGWERADARNDEKILAAREALKTMSPMSSGYGQIAQTAAMKTSAEKAGGSKPEPSGKYSVYMKKGADKTGYEKFRQYYNAAAKKGDTAEMKRLSDIARKNGLID